MNVSSTRRPRIHSTDVAALGVGRMPCNAVGSRGWRTRLKAFPHRGSTAHDRSSRNDAMPKSKRPSSTPSHHGRSLSRNQQGSSCRHRLCCMHRVGTAASPCRSSCGRPGTRCLVRNRVARRRSKRSHLQRLSREPGVRAARPKPETNNPDGDTRTTTFEWSLGS